METIQLKKKSVIEIDLNGKECVASLDTATINHFQKMNQTGLLSVYDKFNENLVDGFDIILKLLGSIIKDKATGMPLGEKYFEAFDMIDIANQLSPVITMLFNDNMPMAKSDQEKNAKRAKKAV